ncbi:HD domain-containing protein [Candidatus Kaiserbacteria bacterium]|nr:HD domain-containing protein [Candidatus Kaiserbacteria bacterium]
MRTPRDIYKEYKLVPALQLHQLRVAAVGKAVCEYYKGNVNEHDVVLACLFHDTGNIIKSDLATFPEFLEPEGRDYWQRVKDEFIKKYGPNEHIATMSIAKEIGLPPAVNGYIEGVGFSQLEATRDSSSYEQKIIEYADLRVGPFGVLLLGERIEEARVRYVGRHTDMPAGHERFAALIRSAHEIEHQLFSSADIAPEDINDVFIAPRIEELWEYPVS